MSIEGAIARLRDLNEPVPKPLRLPSETEVVRAEAEVGMSFPADYRKYLLQASDVVFGVLEPGIVLSDAVHLDLISMAKDAWEKSGVPRTLLPICEDNGDYYCVAPNSQIVFWSHDGVTDEKWPDLATWIDVVWIGGA